MPAPAAAPVVWSLGHSTRTLAEFVALCRVHEVRRIVDVRRYPTSRRHPHFAKDSLALALPREGLHYVHLVDLGGHREPRPDSRHTALVDGAFRGYADHMETPAFAAALAHLMTLARERRTAVMCAEARPDDCHRKLLCDRLVALGVEVLHARDEHTVEPHRLAPAAELERGQLVYRAPHQPGLFDA
jgi:uncharacterized protein (DUF488 family)